ncbi:MAG TPA: hypothetical protein VIT45_00690 [Allosphingosinicella sp.]
MKIATKWLWNIGIYTVKVPFPSETGRKTMFSRAAAFRLVWPTMRVLEWKNGGRGKD